MSVTSCVYVVHLFKLRNVAAKGSYEVFLLLPKKNIVFTVKSAIHEIFLRVI